MKTNCKTNQTEFRVKKVIKRKGDKLYVKLKGCVNPFNNWIDENCIFIKLDIFQNHISIVKIK